MNLQSADRRVQKQVQVPVAAACWSGPQPGPGPAAGLQSALGLDGRSCDGGETGGALSVSPLDS